MRGEGLFVCSSTAIDCLRYTAKELISFIRLQHAVIGLSSQTLNVVMSSYFDFPRDLEFLYRLEQAAHIYFFSRGISRYGRF